MNKYDDICQYLIEQEELYNIEQLCSISFSKIISDEKNNIEEIELTGHWNTSSIKNNKSTQRKKYKITESDDIYDILNKKIQQLRNNITIYKGIIDRIHVNKNINKDKINFVENYPFYTKEDYKYSSMSYIKLEREPTKEITKKVTNYVKKELQKFEKNITEDQIVEIECLYDDFAECKLSCLRGHVVTSKPHKYFKNVNSLEEYINKSGKEKQDTYRIFYRIDDYKKQNEKPKEFSEMLEPLMQNTMNNMVKVNNEYMFEAETISINNYTKYLEHKPEYIGYTESTNSEYISFYVRQPFNEL